MSSLLERIKRIIGRPSPRIEQRMKHESIYSLAGRAVQQAQNAIIAEGMAEEHSEEKVDQEVELYRSLTKTVGSEIVAPNRKGPPASYELDRMAWLHMTEALLEEQFLFLDYDALEDFHQLVLNRVIDSPTRVQN